MRWYLEQEEFYRFVPKESPPSRVFAVFGIVVDVSFITHLLLLLFYPPFQNFHSLNIIICRYWFCLCECVRACAQCSIYYFRLQNNFNLIEIEI